MSLCVFTCMCYLQLTIYISDWVHIRIGCMKVQDSPQNFWTQLAPLEKLSWNNWKIHWSHELEYNIRKWIKLHGKTTKFSLVNVKKIEDTNYNISSQSKIWLYQAMQTSSQPACILMLSVQCREYILQGQCVYNDSWFTARMFSSTSQRNRGSAVTPMLDIDKELRSVSVALGQNAGH